MSNPVSDPDAVRDDRHRPTMDPEHRGGPLRPLGLGTRNVIEGLLGLPVALADAAAYPVNRLYDALRPAPPLSGLITDQQRQPLFRPQGEVVAEILDRLGLPRAETAQERITGRVVQELAGAATMYGAGQTLVRGAGEIIPLIGQTLTTAPTAQATGAAAAGFAGGVAREVAPDSAAADLAASLLGGALGGALPLVLMRNRAGSAAAATARSAGHGQDTAAGVAVQQAGQSERTTARAQQTAANDTAPAPRSNGDDAVHPPADMPADATTPTALAGAPTSPAAPSSVPNSLAAPAIIIGSSTGQPRMTAQQAWERLVRPSSAVFIPRVPGLALPQAARDSRIVTEYLAEWTATPAHRRPPLPDQPGALRQPMPWDALNVPQIMGRDLDATRLDNLAPGLWLPHGHRLSGRGDLAVLRPHVNQVVDRLAEALDPVVVRLARGEHVPGATTEQISAARLAEHYNMRPAYDSILDAGLSPHAARDRLEQEAALLAATSPVTNTRAGQRSAALYGNRFGAGRPIDSEAMADELTAGFNIMPSRHSPLVQRALGSGWTLSRHPKLLTYRSALTGDSTAVPIDSNKVRYISMMFNEVAPGALPRASFATEAGYQSYRAAYRNGGGGMTAEQLREVLVRGPRSQRVNGLHVPSEYTFYHDILTQTAERLGLTPAQTDALLWFRFGADTGLASPHLTQVGVLNERFARAAHALRISPTEAAHRYWRNEIPLPLLAATAGSGALAGLPSPEPERPQTAPR
ncbi:hypothetical protein GXW71_18625 [Roseomonas hellenica]|uniref:Uncharacterized protein n=1 Tax=Plastoroseomonas hellenica TaxID=2687306 RepID=A0ABS5F1F6_9PROT|nr:hypothetical protein [Plastoroseomonas hellenica]MBR0666382.1 hypothetical protein [Plastoroseomonas hellenica]